MSPKLGQPRSSLGRVSQALEVGRPNFVPRAPLMDLEYVNIIFILFFSSSFFSKKIPDLNRQPI